uniref:IS200/IS605 family transposase n=1 Tax=Saliphagus sp. LR7 TaxID=2282654 RepID=UPI000DF77FEA
MKTTRHATYTLNYHIVWLPKYRNSVLGNEVEDRVRRILHEIADEKGLEIVDLTVQPDHVHLFVSSPPKHAPSLLANWFKGISSRKYN